MAITVEELFAWESNRCALFREVVVGVRIKGLFSDTYRLLREHTGGGDNLTDKQYVSAKNREELYRLSDQAKEEPYNIAWRDTRSNSFSAAISDSGLRRRPDGSLRGGSSYAA